MKIECKKPTGTVCLFVVLILTLIFVMIIMIMFGINKLINPLLNDNRNNENFAIESQYINLQIVEKSKDYIIYRDTYTDVLYLEINSNGYSSAITVILNDDGTPKKYSDF